MNFPADGIQTERLHLLPACSNAAGMLLNYQLKNRDHLRPWEPFRTDDFYQLSIIKQRLADMEKQMQTDKAMHFLLFYPDQAQILGECNFTNVVRGPFNACFLGFSIDQQEQGKGLMREALQAAITHMFDIEKLHRIMANYRPENTRSANLLKGLGFEEEGRARHYLKINGRWADHILTARINNDENL